MNELSNSERVDMAERMMYVAKNHANMCKHFLINAQQLYKLAEENSAYQGDLEYQAVCQKVDEEFMNLNNAANMLMEFFAQPYVTGMIQEGRKKG